MNLDIKLKTHKVLELVNYLEGKIDSFEGHLCKGSLHILATGTCSVGDM